MATTKSVPGCVVIMSLATERGKEGEREEEEEGGRERGWRRDGPDARPYCRVTVFIMILKATIESDMGLK